ncbi:ComEA family DNA-binding protein [Cohnella hashimotonis]|uniref:Helix-hairpin-helix domain-containing protein n=1 Tax=Cohnella hashimotonis TaxID=2826895 RepID=A0ABT6TIP2_9BACL|nr:helix-hairpin-helix domain-containing protein [Cohnella hashimotonis]MDI4646702.1 helix-hairpin-helix domain-containing protein [Cohnella hashimotonis]
MGRQSARSAGLRSKAALIAGAAAAALLAWGWLAPSDGKVPGWEPVNAQVAAAVAEAEAGNRKAEGTDKSTSNAPKTGLTATAQSIVPEGAVRPPAGGSKTNASVVAGNSEITGKASGSESGASGDSGTPLKNIDKTTDTFVEAEDVINAGPVTNADDEARQGTQPEASAADGRLDINVASAAQLDALPGIGPAKAEAIVQYRDAHGRFKSAESLRDVKGIGDKLLAKLLPLIKAD